jgi:hypothetical protein
VNAVTGIFRTWWGSLVALIALMLVLEKAGGVSKILGSAEKLSVGTVKAFKG